MSVEMFTCTGDIRRHAGERVPPTPDLSISLSRHPSQRTYSKYGSLKGRTDIWIISAV